VEERENCFIDFEAGKLLSFPAPSDPDFHYLRRREWLKQNGVDGRVETDEGLCGLWTFNTVVIPVSNKRWDSITPAACNSVLEKVKGIYPPIMSAEGRLPTTFLFETSGSRGILQILEVERNTRPKHVKIRYKMLQAGTKAGTVATVATVLRSLTKAKPSILLILITRKWAGSGLNGRTIVALAMKGGCIADR
jgi:hypothetical protein